MLLLEPPDSRWSSGRHFIGDVVGLSVLNCELFAGRSLYSESVRRSQRVPITWERVRRTARRPGTRPNHRRRGGRRRLECLAIRAARSIRSADDAQGSAGPHSLGQRPESTARVVREWVDRVGARTLYIEPRSPWENGYIESFSGKLRDEAMEVASPLDGNRSRKSRASGNV